MAHYISRLARRGFATSVSRESPASHAQLSLPCSYYRGGTSRALFFHEHDLPAREKWVPIFRSVLGSPDPTYGRQLDGMGGGISSLSKICVVGPSSRADADVDYTFAAVDVRGGEVDLGAACGNMTAAVGPWAVDEAVFDPSGASFGEGSNTVTGGQDFERDVTVRIFNTNTQKVIHATFPVIALETSGITSPGGTPRYMASTTGTFGMDGVTGTSAPVRLSFLNPAGSKTGRLLPTGRAVDTVDGPEVSLIDVGNPAVFLAAATLPGLPPLHLVTPDAIDSTPGLLARLDRVRRRAAVLMGVSESVDAVPVGYPKISLIASPPEGAPYDVTVRSISVGQPHKAVPITSALAVAAAVRVDGSVVDRAVSTGRVNAEGLTIGHASGTVVVGSEWDGRGSLVSADVYRTARRIMEGRVFYRAESIT